MIRPVRMFLVAAFLTLIAAIVPVAPAAAAVSRPDQLVILSTTDVKGKTGPCGCHVPKGGLSRRAFYRDSLAKIYGQLSLVDNGGFFPEFDSREDEAWFMMDAMSMLHVDAVGTGANDLRFGLAQLKAHVAAVGLPMTSANLVDAATGHPVLDPYVIRKVGGLQVGYFSLMNVGANLGPAADSLRVDDPAATAKRTVAELRKHGANAVVLLSQLGNVESEDLVTMVPGIDAVICGRNSPVLPKGRMVNQTVAAYPGEQGHYIARTTLTFDKLRKVTARASETTPLGPDVADRADVLEKVTKFDAALNEKLKVLEKNQPAPNSSEGTLGRPQAVTGGGH